MPNDEPISFYIPARNAERTLSACIAAVKCQTRSPEELFVVVDPRSTDRTLDIARSSEVRVVEQEGASLGAARNTAIRVASHRWLACCDSDVFIEASWLQRLAAARPGGAAGIGGRTLERVLSHADAWRGLHMPHHWGRYPLRNPFMLVSEVLFDRRALLDIGGYRDDLNYHEDSDLSQRLRDAGFDLQYEPGAVGHHQRTDTLESVLTLRWKYSEYRQHHLLDTFAGLLQKLHVNREYALTTLARCFVRRQPHLAYISFLLFFHHAIMDLSAMLSRRPLLEVIDQQNCLAQVVVRMGNAVRRVLPGIAGCLAGDLSQFQPSPPQEDIGRPRQSKNVEPAASPPAWIRYLDGIEASARALCDEVDSIWSTLHASAAAVHNPEADGSCSFLMPNIEAIEAELAQVNLAPAVDGAFCRWLSERGFQNADIVGPALPSESALLDKRTAAHMENGAGRVTVVPHLEARVDPLGAFGEMDPATCQAVMCYQPPARFIAGLDVPSASDLAEAAAAAGWTVEHFDTLVGRTRLLLRRVETHCRSD